MQNAAKRSRGEIYNMKNPVVFTLENPVSNAKSGTPSPKLEPEFGKAF